MNFVEGFAINDADDDDFVQNPVGIKEATEPLAFSFPQPSMRIRIKKEPKKKVPKKLPSTAKETNGNQRGRRRVRSKVGAGAGSRLHCVTDWERHVVVSGRVSEIIDETTERNEAEVERYKFHVKEVPVGINQRLRAYLAKDRPLWTSGTGELQPIQTPLSSPYSSPMKEFPKLSSQGENEAVIVEDSDVDNVLEENEMRVEGILDQAFSGNDSFFAKIPMWGEGDRLESPAPSPTPTSFLPRFISSPSSPSLLCKENHVRAEAALPIQASPISHYPQGRKATRPPNKKKPKLMLPKKLDEKTRQLNKNGVESDPRTCRVERCSSESPPRSPCSPLLNYSIIDTPILKGELKRYGLKPFPRSKAKVLLRHIYKETHKK